MAVVSRPRGADWVIVSPAPSSPMVSLIGYLLIQPGNRCLMSRCPGPESVNRRGSGRDRYNASLNWILSGFHFLLFCLSFNSQYLQREPRSTQLAGLRLTRALHTPTAAAQKTPNKGRTGRTHFCRVIACNSGSFGTSSLPFFWYLLWSVWKGERAKGMRRAMSDNAEIYY